MKSVELPSKHQIASFDVHAFTPICPDELPVAEGDQVVVELNAQPKKRDPASVQRESNLGG